jgi:hypothetical protein
MALRRWSNVDDDAIMEAIQRINQRQAGAGVDLVGLLGLMYRYLHDPAFPQKLREPLRQCVLAFRYSSNDKGSDVLDRQSESGQILFATCQLLAGQLYPGQSLGRPGRDGQWHRKRGEQSVWDWLQQRSAGGFAEWDSNTAFEVDLLALSHLADLAASTRIWGLAATVMDKLLFSMALNSYRGAFGSTHGRTDGPSVQSARLEPTSGVARLMWGLGTFNPHISGTVALACARRYGLPAVVERVAHDLPEGMWGREHHGGPLRGAHDHPVSPWEVDKVTYKTPDYMLSSVQDYRPGARGDRQHIWQATMGPDAAVFATHPPCLSESDSLRPNFWRGNSVLPRVAQWRDVLIAIHPPPRAGWLGFTHAYFPLHAFDEHHLREGWAFARKGEGYLALTAAQGMQLIAQGQSAYRELRSDGLPNIWLCHMGRARQDGSFGQFRERVLALDVDYEELGVRCATLRGQTVSFGWEGPLIIDGMEQPITGFMHYDTPYAAVSWPATDMEIHFGGQSLALDVDE